MNITDSVIVACHTLEIFHCQFDPCDNSPKAVAAATERFIKQNEPQASAWGRNWIAAGCSAYCFRLYHCRMFNLGIKLQHGRSLDLCWRWLGKSRQDWIVSMSVLRAMDLSSCGAGSINMALVILGFSPEGGQQHQRADLCMAKSPRMLVPVSEEMQNRLSPQVQLELHRHKTTSAASFTEIYFLN